MRIAASESHVAVNWRLDARHTSSRSGPAGRVSRVVSLGRQVMDLKSSLRVCKMTNQQLSNSEIIGPT
jgi:hypothetical protein